MEETNADDVPDLETARRIITHLRKTVARLEEEGYPLEHEYAIFLDEEYSTKIAWLHLAGKLTYSQRNDPDLELDEALEDFVREQIDIAYDTEMLEHDRLSRHNPPMA